MSRVIREIGDRLSGAGVSLMAGWVRFWFEPRSMYPLALVRIVFGVFIFFWALTLLPQTRQLLGPNGVLPEPLPAGPLTWSVLRVFNTDAAVVTVVIALLVASVALIVGWHSRLAALIVFVAILSIERRQPWVFNAGDGLLRIESFFLMLAPSGAALSLDQRRTSGSFFSAQDRAPWGLRLFQLQISVVYLSTVWDKVSGQTWNAGTAVSYALRIEDLQNFVVPDWIVLNAPLMNLATWGTLAIELAIGVLVWHRKARLWVLAAGVVLHVSILATIAVGFFTFSVFVLYAAFVSPETVRWGSEWIRQRLTRKPEAVDPEPVQPEPAQAPESVH